MSSTRRPNPRGNLIFKDVTSDGDDCDSHVDEGEQDEEGKDASGEAHERDKGLGAAALSWREDVCEFCLLYTSPSPRDQRGSRMPSSA